MLAYGKIMPKNNQISVLCPELIENFPEKVKNYPEENLPKNKKFLPRKENLPNTCSPATSSPRVKDPIQVITFDVYTPCAGPPGLKQTETRSEKTVEPQETGSVNQDALDLP